MIAKNVNCDVNVICLVGERGREVQEFILHNLGEEGLKNSVLVVITSDESPALQVKGTFLATTIAEYFRDQGLSVLLLMDSLTRLALAQRQIGLAAGEPPTTRGFTPSVFGLLAPLLERAGPGEPPGSITAVYTVLVEGDDVNDPIGDAVRGIVDGHIVLSRKLASHGHYPAIDVLSSLSRIMAQVTDPEHQATASKVRDLLATWSENEELIRLGAYRKGSSKPVDEAISRHPMIKDFLIQDVKDPTEPNEMLQRLTSAVS
jgi:flagellum-specific ATP synthase